jgi:hypothetical protein
MIMPSIIGPLVRMSSWPGQETRGPTSAPRRPIVSRGVGARKSVVGAELRIRRRGNPATMIGSMTFRLLYLLFGKVLRWLALLAEARPPRTLSC